MAAPEQPTPDAGAPRRLIVGRDVGVRDLKGWPAIAAFLGRSEWWCVKQSRKRKHPLPVYREGDSRMAVAYSTELAAWLTTHHEQNR
ncbi:MAG: hypothetical protein IT379_39490 [Deltaproteobacteria bacterium]|nr:hypothetical protein [Deltaproteobacteria bacterium]